LILVNSNKNPAGVKSARLGRKNHWFQPSLQIKLS